MSNTDNSLLHDPDIQHGIDDDPTNDPKKGAELGGLGGAVVGAAAGAAGGPGAAVIGAAIGAVAGAAASGAAVAGVHKVDNENNVSGVGDGVTIKKEARFEDTE